MKSAIAYVYTCSENEFIYPQSLKWALSVNKTSTVPQIPLVQINKQWLMFLESLIKKAARLKFSSYF